MKKNSMVFPLLCLILFLCSHAFAFAEQSATVTMKDGTIHTGTVLNENKDEIHLKTSDGVEMKIPKSQLSSISYDTEAQGFRPYTAFGGTLLMPGGVNLVLARHYEKLGFRLEGGYIGTIYGGQAGLLYNIGRTKNFAHHLGLIFGHSYMEAREAATINGMKVEGIDVIVPKTWSYGGLSYDLNYKGFFLEGGLTAGSGDFTSPQLLVSLGYVYEFR